MQKHYATCSNHEAPLHMLVLLPSNPTRMFAKIAQGLQQEEFIYQGFPSMQQANIVIDDLGPSSLRFFFGNSSEKPPKFHRISLIQASKTSQNLSKDRKKMMAAAQVGQYSFSVRTMGFGLKNRMTDFPEITGEWFPIGFSFN